MRFSDIQELVYGEYKKNGYEYMWNLEDLKMLIRNCYPEPQVYFNGLQFKQLLRIADIGEVGLVNTEVSELLEDIRKDKNEIDQLKECADIIIRVMNYCNRKGLDLETAILAKHDVNMTRGELHGKLV
jgi:hypothetical protein